MVDKGFGRGDHLLGLVAVGRVAALRQLEQLGGRQTLGDAANLGQRAVRVVQPLDRQHRAADVDEFVGDVPARECRLEPYVVPAPEDQVRIVVVGRKPVAQRATFVAGLGLAYTRGGDVFHEDVRCQKDQARDALRESSRMQQRDRAAIAVAEKPDGLLDIQRVEQCRQDLIGLSVHVVHIQRLGGRARARAAVTGAREHQAARAHGAAQPRGEILPHRQGAQAFVQEHHERGLGAGRVEPGVFHLHLPAGPGKGDEVAHRPASRSRRRKRWILPVAVLGSSVRNSIWRGYL
ncbi:hypothetical protein D3C78_1153280 [compost metagenome]